MSASAGAPMSACTVTWWGHATVEVVMDGVRILTDPLLRRWLGPLHSVGHHPARNRESGPGRRAALDADLGSVDAVLLSHLHRDHVDLASVARFPRHTRVLVPRGAGRIVRRRARAQVEEHDIGDVADVGPVRVEVTYAEHGGHRKLGGGFAEPVGFLLRGSATVYFAGDTDIFPAMAGLAGSGLDVALLPIGGWGLTLGPGHLDPARAAQAVRLLRPRIAVPIHWGTLRVPVAWRVRGRHGPAAAAAFVEHTARLAPETQVVVATPGQGIDVGRHRLPAGGGRDGRG